MTATFHVGDALEVMATLPEKSVDLVLTSPPFLALRSYLPADHPDKGKEGGSQATPGEYIDWLIDIAEACDRVLAPHGSMCIELGDTYSGDTGGHAGGDNTGNGRYGEPRIVGTKGKTGWPLAKSLSLIPELFRFSLVYGFNPLTGRQTERWRLRNVVRWVRPNPPVGALGDKFRPATSELMVFCKSAKRYFDLDAVRSPVLGAETRTVGDKGKQGHAGQGERPPGRGGANYADTMRINPAGSPPLDWWNIPIIEGEEPTRYGPQPQEKRDIAKGMSYHGSGTERRPGDGRYQGEDEGKRIFSNPAGAPPLDWWNIPLLEGEEETRYGPKEPEPKVSKPRNRQGEPSMTRGGSGVPTDGWHLGAPPLDWWEIPPGGYEGAHYAVFPPELCVKPIKAMCPSLVCLECGPIYDVRTLPESGAAKEHAVLLEEVRAGLGAKTTGSVKGLHDSSGLHHGEWDEGTSDGNGRGVHLPASPSDGRTPRADAPTDRSRSPQERDQERQPDRELGSNGQGRPHESRTDGPRTADDALPSLRRSSEFLRDCPRCGGPTRVGRVLDPFAGSGTTLAVATGHGRDAIGIDLDARNFDLALERVGPFILELGTLDD